MAEPILEIMNLKKAFGGLMAIMELSFQIQPGQIKSVIGPNGAGKTTLFNLITGIFPPTEGKIHFFGRDVVGSKPYQIAKLGISRTFQTVELFGNMSVAENVMVGLHPRTKFGLFSAGFRVPGMRREEKEILKKSMDLLELSGLGQKAGQSATSLPLGEQKLLEVTRALATDPQLLLLDEPAAGLNEAETERMSGLIYNIRKRGVTILLVEHDMSLVMKVSDAIVVLNFGEKIAEGTPEEIKSDPRVIDAYLGGEI